MDKVSIIIPNFNNAKWLPKCLDSCLQQQGYFQKEIIVIDDHSTDNSLEILKEYQQKHSEELHFYPNPKKGGNSARNYGFSKSTGNYIQWLDSDDFLLEGKFKNQLNFLETNKNVDVVFSDWRMDTYDDNCEIIDKQIKTRTSYNDFLIVLLKNILWNVPNTYLMKREICEKAVLENAWNEQTKVGQDREFFTIAAILGARFGYSSGLYSTYNRWSKETVSTKYKEKEITLESIKLNTRFFNEIEQSQILKQKQKYKNVLNTELLNALFHQPKLKLPRTFLPWHMDFSALHFKLKLISPILYIYHLIKA